jgi:hypothetical protein
MSTLLFENRWSVIGSLALLACLAYVRSAWQLPLISDDYLVIGLSLQWGPPEGWLDLLLHPLYRGRATSIVLTYWTYKLFHLTPQAYALVSLILHIANASLLYSFGRFPRIGWPTAAIAAGFFTVYEGHQEAVIWFSALPELLVFLFGLGAAWVWLEWLHTGRKRWLGAAFVLFTFALLSKESAVALAPLLALLWWWHRDKHPQMPWAALCGFALLAAGYTLWAFLGKQGNHHFADGTFDLSAPFPLTIRNSMGRMLWFWGLLSLITLLVLKPLRWRAAITAALLWMLIALLPYSFLSYMPRVPSRHTYLAAAGLALLVSAAIQALWTPQRRALTALVVAVLILHNVGYLWLRKHQQYVERAAPTEELIRLAARSDGPILVTAFPYSKEIAIWAVKLAVDKPGVTVIFNPAEAPPQTPVFSWVE